jgi:hypothetical protein
MNGFQVSMETDGLHEQIHLKDINQQHLLIQCTNKAPIKRL